MAELESTEAYTPESGRGRLREKEIGSGPFWSSLIIEHEGGIW